MDDPRPGLPPSADTYERRLAERRERERSLDRIHRALGYTKLGVFLAAAGFLARALQQGTGWPWTPLGIAAGLFVALAAIQERVGGRLETARRAGRFYRRGLDRLAGSLPDDAHRGGRFRDAGHPYAADLDLFGRGSLFQRLNLCATLHGEDALARRLLSASPEPLSAAVVRLRQDAIRDLILRLDLRESMAVAGETAHESRRERRGIQAWIDAGPAYGNTSLLRAAGLGLPALGIALAITASRTQMPFWPVWLVVAALIAVYLATGKKAAQVLGRVDAPARVLSSYERLARCLEGEAFAAADLVALREALHAPEALASTEIRRLRRVVSWADALRNDLFAAVAGPLLLWHLNCALALEAWRRRCGEALGRWLAAIGEAEATASLAALAHEHPEHVFPEILDDGPPSLHIEDVGHPLLGTGCVRNTVSLEAPGSVLLVSGSNSSGKSTLLRSVGVNTVLAMAGSVVHARAMVLPPLAPATSMRLVDSLQEGTSHFVAEIKRLRKVMDVAVSGAPVLFLLDEILQGTNARERHLGALSLVGELIRRGTIGLVTTHDLALADLAEEHPGKVRNVHFADHIEDGRMVFDYKMQPGVIGSTNALRLMKANGLPVDV